MIQKAALAILAINVVGFIFLWNRNRNLLYSVFSLSLLMLFGLTLGVEFTSEWREHQKQYIQMLAEREKDLEIIKTLRSTPLAIKQIWNRELGIADRCVTCHLAVDNPAFEKVAEPFKYHKAAREHDFKKIGCTICHQGQGRATEAEQAHAYEIPHWDKPMLKGDAVQSACPQCHVRLYEPGYALKGANLITSARDLTLGKNELEMECTVCHTMRGVGEVLAPDLTEFGETTEHDFEQTHNMKHVEGKKSKYEWTYQHFINPEKITPGNQATGEAPTIMPDFKFTPEQAHALTVYMSSFRPSVIPGAYQYRELTPKEKEVKARVSFIEEFEQSYGDFSKLPPGQQLYVRSNCWFCHTVADSGGKVGPELTRVGARRSKDALTEFFRDLPNKKTHPMSRRFKFSDEQINVLTDYLAGLK